MAGRATSRHFAAKVEQSLENSGATPAVAYLRSWDRRVEADILLPLEANTERNSRFISWRLSTGWTLFCGLPGSLKDQACQVEGKGQRIADDHRPGRVGEALVCPGVIVIGCLRIMPGGKTTVFLAGRGYHICNPVRSEVQILSPRHFFTNIALQ